MTRPRKRLVIISVIVLVAAGITTAAWPRKKVEVVRMARVERFPELKAIVNGTGEIRAKYSVDIQTEIAGVIIELPVKEGDHVEKGQILLKVDPFQTDTDVQSARAQMSALEAEAAAQAFQIASSEANMARDEFLKKTGEVELRQADANMARARESMNREKRLLEANLLSADQFEITETQFKVDEAQVEAAGARIKQLEAQIVAARANIEFAKTSRDAALQRVEAARSSLRRNEDLHQKTTIRSPITGVIVKLNVDVGERAVPGILSNPQATLMTIADMSIIEAELKVDETDIVNVKMGDPGIVIVDALPDDRLVGSVVEVGNAPISLTSSGGSGGMSSSSSNQEGKDFKVIVRLENPPAALRPGMSCESDITTAVKSDVLVAPIQALTMREVELDEEGRYKPPPPEEIAASGRTVAAEPPPRERRKELQGVFMVERETARFRPVKAGITGEMEIEITNGLAEGDEVVVGPLKALRGLKEHDAVRIDREKPYRRPLRRGVRVDEDEEKKG